MFRTKSDVDRFANKILNQAKSTQKKCSEGLRIAKLYFDLKEYECAQNYLASYISENPNDPLGWKLMGEIHENSEDWSKAIDCFSKYYELDPQACTILLKICQCFRNLDKSYDKAILWIEKTEKVYPYAKQVTELKEKIWNSKQNIDWEGYLKRAIANNPNEEELKFKLLKCLVEQKKMINAIEFILETDINNFNMLSSLWYDNTISLVEDFIIDSCEENVYLTYLLLLNQKFFLYIEQNEFDLARGVIQKVDQMIRNYEAHANYNKNYKIEVLNEIKAQFFYICGLFIIRNINSQKLNINDSDDIMLCNICFIISSFKSKPNSLKRSTRNSTGSKIEERLVDYAHLNSCFRYTVLGHWLKKASINDQLKFIDQIKKFCVNNKIKEILKSKIYDQQSLNSYNDGFFNNSTDFEIPNSEYLFIDLLTLDYAEKFCLQSQSYNLKLIIWFAMIQFYKYDIDSPRLYIPNIGSIPFGVENLNLASWDSISALDLEVFLYAALIQAYSFNNIKNIKTAFIQPYWLQKHLCTNDQLNWWFNCIKQLESKTQIQKQTINNKTIQQLNHALEIIRLNKTNSKLMNFQIAIKIAIYLQNRLNSAINEQTNLQADLNTSDSSRSNEVNVVYSKSEYDILPSSEKFKYINLYVTQYWCYIANYIKVTFNMNDEAGGLNESFKALSVDMNKKQQNYFFDILNNFTELFENDQFNHNIYQLALLYLANKKISDENYLVIIDLIKDIHFDKPNFNDKIGYRVAKYFKTLSERILLSKRTPEEDEDYKNLVDLIKEKLFYAIEYLDKYKAATSVIEKSPVKIQTPVKQQEINYNLSQQQSLSPLIQKHLLAEETEEIKSPIRIERKENILGLSPVKADKKEEELEMNQTNLSLYKSINENIRTMNTTVETDNLSMQTANDTLNSAKSKQTTTSNSFEISKTEESLFTSPKADLKTSQLIETPVKINEPVVKEEPKTPVTSPQQQQQQQQKSPSRLDTKQIIELIKAKQSVKLSLYRDILLNQFSTINKQREQIKQEMKDLHNVLSKVKSNYSS